MEQYNEYYNNNSPIKDPHKSFDEKIDEAFDDIANGRVEPFDEFMNSLIKEYNIEL